MFLKVAIQGFINCCQTLPRPKAAGPDVIKPIVLKTLKDQISPILQIIFQQSLARGQIPSDWKTAFKKSDPGNYRPVSLTCVCCKLMEHIAVSNLTKHLDKHNILYDLQHGFRRSCESQLIQLVDELAKNLSSSHQTDLILLDFSEAFDKPRYQTTL